MSTFTANKIMNGAFGTLFYDGVQIAECSAAQAKQQVQREDHQIPGSMAIDSKATGTKGTGSMTLKHVFSRFTTYMKEIQEGRDPRATLILKLDDPDAYGAERVALYDVTFDEVTLMDFATGKTTDYTAPFRFTRAEFLNEVAPR